jgi:PAS domain S-box-containing protein
MEKGLSGQIGREVLRILLLEDRDADAELVERALRKAGFAYTFDRARCEADFLAKLDPPPHVIVSDYYVPGCDALHALRLVRSRGLDVPFIVVSGVIGETRALEAMRLGATDFLLKDRLGRLGAAIRTALELDGPAPRYAPGARPRQVRTENEFREAFDNAAIGMALTTLDGRWLHVNTAFSAVTGYGSEELELSDCRDIIHPEDAGEDAEVLRRLVAGEIGISQQETRYLHKLGHPLWVQVTASLTRDRNGRPLHRMLQVIDIADRRQTEARLARADRARKVMAECSHALVHAVDEGQFLQEMCRIAVESGGYVQAYIGFAGDDTRKSVRPVAEAGFEPGYLGKGRRSWSGSGRRKSVMGDVIASGQRFISRDISADPKLRAWTERARNRGYQSLICLPPGDRGTPGPAASASTHVSLTPSITTRSNCSRCSRATSPTASPRCGRAPRCARARRISARRSSMRRWASRTPPSRGCFCRPTRGCARCWDTRAPNWRR